ncbi:MAG: ATP-binding protein [Clostridia bacterium]
MEKSILTECRAKLLQQHNELIQEAEQKTRELHIKIPRIAEIDDQLASVSVRMLVAATQPNFNLTATDIKHETENLKNERALVLIDNGYSADYDEPDFVCRKCNDNGYIGYKMCECLKHMAAAEGYRRSGIGGALAECTFENFDTRYYSGDLISGIHPRDIMENTKSACQKYAENFSCDGKNILLCGNTGLGKTHISAAIAGEVIKKGFVVYYESAQEILNQYRNVAFNGGDDDTSKYLFCDLLIIDDFGAEGKNEFGASLFIELINKRIITKKSTIISTNLTSKELTTRYSSRLSSRILGEYKVLGFYGKDIRMIKKTGNQE